MPEFKRVREGGWEYSIPATRVTDAVEVLDKRALAPSGKPIPPKPVTDLGTPATGSKRDRQRTATKTTEVDSPGKDAGETSATPETES